MSERQLSRQQSSCGQVRRKARPEMAAGLSLEPIHDRFHTGQDNGISRSPDTRSLRKVRDILALDVLLHDSNPRETLTVALRLLMKNPGEQAMAKIPKPTITVASAVVFHFAATMRTVYLCSMLLSRKSMMSSGALPSSLRSAPRPNFLLSSRTGSQTGSPQSPTIGLGSRASSSRRRYAGRAQICCRNVSRSSLPNSAPAIARFFPISSCRERRSRLRRNRRTSSKAE